MFESEATRTRIDDRFSQRSSIALQLQSIQRIIWKKFFFQSQNVIFLKVSNVLLLIYGGSTCRPSGVFFSHCKCRVNFPKSKMNFFHIVSAECRTGVFVVCALQTPNQVCLSSGTPTQGYGVFYIPKPPDRGRPQNEGRPLV